MQVIAGCSILQCHIHQRGHMVTVHDVTSECRSPCNAQCYSTDCNLLACKHTKAQYDDSGYLCIDNSISRLTLWLTIATVHARKAAAKPAMWAKIFMRGISPSRVSIAQQAQ